MASSSVQAQMMAAANVPSAENPPGMEMTSLAQAMEMSRDVQMQRHSPHNMQNGAGKGKIVEKVRMKDGKKVYTVRKDKDGKKYIQVNKKVVHLGTIRGKYLYV